MANYYCTSRTNYFRVKDEKVFEEWAARFGMEVIRDSAGRFGLLPGCSTDGGDFPCGDPETDEEFEFPLKLAEFLADGSIAVVMEAGAEKSRYVVGWAIAVDNKGQSVGVSLHDIYEAASENLTGEVTECQY